MAKKNILSTLLIASMFLAGIVLLLYPTVSNWWNKRHSSRTIDDYQSIVYTLDAEQSEILYQGAMAFNKYIASHPDRWHLLKEDLEIYEKTLDVTGTGIMGYLDVPKIGLEMPIYHGTKEEVLQLGVGHMEGSTLPIGGPSTHCVLSGHTGLASAKLFTKLDQLENGDIFTVSVLNKTLTYQVVDILIKLPDEMEALDIVDGKDYCTLLTCTPYGVNSHRLLVRGERVEIPPAVEEDPVVYLPVTREENLLVFVVLLVVDGIAILLSILLYIKYKKCRR